MATVAKSDRSTIITLASASAGPFDLTFRLFDEDGLDVYVNNVATTNWTLNSDFVGGFDDGATITFDAPLEIADVILIESNLVPNRGQDYQDGPGLTEKLNIELARLWSSLSDRARDKSKSLRFFQSVSPISLIAGRALVVNEGGDGVEMGATSGEIAGAQGYAELAKAWAESDTSPDETSSKSSKTWAGEAATSAGLAATAKIAAEDAQATVETILDSFDDRYLGAKAADPTLDNDGDALVVGALYFNTTDSEMRLYNGTLWVAFTAGLELALKKSLNLSDVASADTSLTNLGFTVNAISLIKLTYAGMKTALGLGTAATATNSSDTTLGGGSPSATKLPNEVAVQGYVADESPLKMRICFNGTGTIAIKSSFNVASITDLGVGNYRITFTDDLEDVDYSYSIQASGPTSGTDGFSYGVEAKGYTVKNVGYFEFGIGYPASALLYDHSDISVMIFR